MGNGSVWLINRHLCGRKMSRERYLSVTTTRCPVTSRMSHPPASRDRHRRGLGRLDHLHDPRSRRRDSPVLHRSRSAPASGRLPRRAAGFHLHRAGGGGGALPARQQGNRPGRTPVIDGVDPSAACIVNQLEFAQAGRAEPLWSCERGNRFQLIGVKVNSITWKPA